MSNADIYIKGAVLWVVAGPAVATNFIVSSELSAYSQRQARKRAKAARQDRMLTIRSASEPRRYVLGEVRIGGVVVYADTVGELKQAFDQVLALCEGWGPIGGLQSIFFNEEAATTASFTGDSPSSGKYAATNLRSKTYFETRTVSASNTFTLSRAPASADDVLVTRRGTPPTTLAVASVSGSTVTLTATTTGTLDVNYEVLNNDAPLRLHWTQGKSFEDAQAWSGGVITPKWTSAHRMHGTVRLRSLMNWDKNIYAEGPPQLSAVARGVCPYDHRRNRHPSPGLRNAVAGSPGTLPALVSASPGIDGLSRQMYESGMEDGLPFMEIRISGTATASGFYSIDLPTPVSGPAASVGQEWKSRVYIRRVSGSLDAFATARLWLVSYLSDGTGRVFEAGLDLLDSTTGITRELIGCAHETPPDIISQSGRVNAQIRLQYVAGQTYNVRLRVGLPMLWRTTDPIGWSSNPAVLWHWFGLLPRIRGGKGWDWDYVELDWLIDAANVCDELISVRTLDGTGFEDVKRYECHTVLSLDASPDDNHARILDSMAGAMAFTAGRYRVAAGAFRAAARTLTDDDIHQDSPIQLDPATNGLDTLPNMVTATFADKAKAYIETAAKPVVNDVYVSQDGGEKEPLSLQLDATTDGRQANYLMGVMLERARGGRSLQVTVTGIGGDIAVLDTLQFDVTGWEVLDGRTWEVRRRTNNWDGTYSLALQEIAATTYELDAERFTPVNQPLPTDLSYLWDVDPVPNFAATPLPSTVLPDGSTPLRISCTWDLHPQEYVRQSGRIEFRYRRSDSPTWTEHPAVPGDETSTIITLAADDGARYIVQARAVNGLGAYSKWNSRPSNVDSGDTVEPGTSTGGVTGNLSLTAETIVVDPADATAGIRFNRDGSISVRNSVSPGGYTTATKRWHTSTSTTIGDGYWVQFRRISGDTNSAGTLVTRQQLNAARLIEHQSTIPNNESAATYSVAIYTSAGAGTPVATGVLSIAAFVEL